jgi:hypothetical protein
MICKYRSCWNRGSSNAASPLSLPFFFVNTHCQEMCIILWLVYSISVCSFTFPRYTWWFFIFFYVLHTTTTSLFWAFHSKSMVALEGSVYLTWIFFFYHIMHGLIFIYIFCFSCNLKLSFWAFHSKSTVASGGDVYLAYSNLIFAKFLHHVFLSFYMLLIWEYW